MLKQPKTYEINTHKLLTKFLAKLVANVNKLEKRIEQLEINPKNSAKKKAKKDKETDNEN